jgi:lysophospholipase L1-like esterase
MTDPLIGATTAAFAISLSVALTEPVDVAWSTKDGTAKAGIDYQAASGVVTFLPGETEKQVQVIVYGQSTVGPDKTFYIALTPPTNAILGNSLVDCIITVVDDEGTPITMVIVAQGKRGFKGDPGLSAYQQAALMGYTGTVEQWMAEIADASAAANRSSQSANESAGYAANSAASAASAENIAVTITALNNGQEYYLTQAELLATTPSVTKKAAKALDTKKVWLWQKPGAPAGTWTDTGLSELDQAKAEIQRSAQFNGWFDPAFELLDLTNRNYFGRERMWNGFGGWSKVQNAFFGGKAMRRADGYNVTTLSGFVTHLDELGVVTGDSITAYVLCVGNASNVYSVARFQDAVGNVYGGSPLMLNEAGTNILATSLTTPKWLRLTLTVPAGADRLIVYPYNASGTVGFDVIGHWVSIGTISTVSQFPLYRTPLPTLRYNDLVGRIAAPFDVYINSKHSTEKVGNGTYGLIKMGGFYEVAAKAGNVNAVQCRIWKSIPSDVDVRIYKRLSTDSLAFNPSLITPNQSFTIAAANFPTTDQDFYIKFPADIYLNAGELLYVLFKATDGGAFNNKIWSYDASATPARHGFALSTISDWNGTIGISSAPLGYGATSMALLRLYGEFDFRCDAVNIRYGSSNVDTALKALEAALPSIAPPIIIIPPKVYAVQNKEMNVYFNNLLTGPVSDFLVDVSASVGIQQCERLVINSATASTANATITLSDKKTGTQLATATTSLQVVASSAKSGTTQKVSVIGDSLTSAGTITQTLLDNASTDVMGVQLIGTLGTGLNKHEGRGGWGINSYTTAGPTYWAFTVSGVTVTPLINATEYTNNGTTFRVQSVNLTGGAGTIVCSVQSGSNAPTASGTLTKSNAVAGDATIAFSASASQPGNPFWISGAVNYAQYLVNNSLVTPDFVAIMLGINDVFAQTSDANATSTATTRLNQLDTLIASIKAVNGTIKVLLMIPPPPAGQDAFGKNYLVGETAWRHKRNIVLWAQSMIAKYSGQEANRIYLVPTNVAIDTVNNYPTETVAINSRNTNTMVRQSNGVHPDTSGYQQIADALTAALKAI